jgi:hypothetical protein
MGKYLVTLGEDLGQLLRKIHTNPQPKISLLSASSLINVNSITENVKSEDPP